MKKDKEIVDLWQYERDLFNQGYQYIGGCDEAGRGPLVGPVVAACCVLPRDFYLEGLTDSKKLTEKKREQYFPYIKEHAIAYGIGVVSASRIDEINIYQASREAMILAIREVQKKIGVEYILSDAMPIHIEVPCLPIVKGDAKSISIAAASVIAKVTRDHMMLELDMKYPMYGFSKHKGYPTKSHLEAINQYGLIEDYRKTYGPIKKIIEENENEKVC